MPVNLTEPHTIKIVTAHRWLIRAIHYEALDKNAEAVCVLDIVLQDAGGADLETRQLRTPLYELVARYPALYASLKAASYAEAETLGGLPAGELE